MYLLVAILPLYGLFITTIVHYYCSYKFLNMLVMVSERYIYSKPYKMVKNLRNIVTFSSLIAIIASIIFFIGFINEDQQISPPGNFPYTLSYIGLQLHSVVLLLNLVISHLFSNIYIFLVWVV